MRKKLAEMSMKSRILLIIAAAVLAFAAYTLEYNSVRAAAEDQLVKVWILCKPGSQVNVRRRQSTSSQADGFLEAGDSFLTDGESRNGWIRCYGIGEYGEGWVYCGYVSTEEPEIIGEQYVCVAPKQVACRRWIGGPQTEKKWLRNGGRVDVFCMADGWAVTSRGYIRSEWLEPDPR